ncbi:regulatory-associated protein of mTOR, partial [Thraustotheca clavata]
MGTRKKTFVMEDRHLNRLLWGEKDEQETLVQPWRMGTPRLKTMDVALVLCLNIGTDPPDIVKPSPCARKECWVEPFSMPAQKALETIGKTLQSQYERWQPRARYRQSLDPTVDEIKQLCISLRRHAKHDRVLFHYNGHGVPRPTQNGEIWVFNKSYTQYIPLLVYELQAWVGTPSLYVFDCSAAGILLQHFASSSDAFVLAACGADEILPMHPDMCADVFTSCLTTPITVALRWFLSQNERSMGHLEPSVIDRIPGKLTDRKTPLGELNWIFTAITDTIAWNLLPAPLFQTLFRQDLLVASLFRNFLLAERIMTTLGCTPCSLPALPSTAHHPLWRSW